MKCMLRFIHTHHTLISYTLLWFRFIALPLIVTILYVLFFYENRCFSVAIRFWIQYQHIISRCNVDNESDTYLLHAYYCRRRCCCCFFFYFSFFFSISHLLMLNERYSYYLLLFVNSLPIPQLLQLLLLFFHSENYYLFISRKSSLSETELNSHLIVFWNSKPCSQM